MVRTLGSQPSNTGPTPVGATVKYMYKLLIFIISVSIFALSLKPVLAEEFNLPEANEGQVSEAQNRLVPLRFLPGQTFYFLITIKEEIDRAFQPSSAKRAEFDFVLSGKRLKEAYLLLLKGDMIGANKALGKYAERTEKMINNLRRARSQNQNVNPVVLEIGEELKSHEVLLSAINKQRRIVDAGLIEDNFKKSLGVFIDAVTAINEVKPGIRDRFKSATESANLKESTETATPQDNVVNNKSYSPRRIIY